MHRGPKPRARAWLYPVVGDRGKSLILRKARWVLLNYPVITSRSRDNAGGYDHLVGNLQVYRHMGFKVVCICRWAPNLIDRFEGAWILNIVPGAAVPKTPSSVCADQVGVSPTSQLPEAWRWIAQGLRGVVLTLLCAGLQRLLRPCLLHQRANLRLMISPSDNEIAHLVELNDEYVPQAVCDAYLTVVPRPSLPVAQFIWRWPVPEVASFDAQLFQQRLIELAQPSRRIKVVLFGIGGTTSLKVIHRFIAEHSWFQGVDFELHVYGGHGNSSFVEGVVHHNWCEPAQFDSQNYDAGVLYYDPLVYDDKRLSLGSPTKLWKYIDWSLPVFSNRSFVSKHFLGCFDENRNVLLSKDLAQKYADHLQALRRETLPITYADQMFGFLQKNFLLSSK